MAYGDKRDYPKIDIYAAGVYQCSTTWARTCKEAIEHYKSPTGGNARITAFPSKRSDGDALASSKMQHYRS